MRFDELGRHGARHAALHRHDIERLRRVLGLHLDAHTLHRIDPTRVDAVLTHPQHGPRHGIRVADAHVDERTIGVIGLDDPEVADGLALRERPRELVTRMRVARRLLRNHRGRLAVHRDDAEGSAIGALDHGLALTRALADEIDVGRHRPHGQRHFPLHGHLDRTRIALRDDLQLRSSDPLHRRTAEFGLDDEALARFDRHAGGIGDGGALAGRRDAEQRHRRGAGVQQRQRPTCIGVGQHEAEVESLRRDRDGRRSIDRTVLDRIGRLACGRRVGGFRSAGARRAHPGPIEPGVLALPLLLGGRSSGRGSGWRSGRGRRGLIGRLTRLGRRDRRRVLKIRACRGTRSVRRTEGAENDMEQDEAGPTRGSGERHGWNPIRRPPFLRWNWG